MFPFTCSSSNIYALADDISSEEIKFAPVPAIFFIMTVPGEMGAVQEIFLAEAITFGINSFETGTSVRTATRG